jgi:adenine/guanine phosphoribosyltransferase-like PRPP-binding protein
MIDPQNFWQQIDPPGHGATVGPFEHFYVADIDGGQLRLPIRMLADGQHALASLIINQASFAVQEALAKALAEKIAGLAIDIVIGLPTLGLTLASAVARHLGHSRYVPLGTSRKFWYRDELSVPLSSITTPEQKRLYIDPRLLPLIEGRRVVLIDDVISSGSSIVAGLKLMDLCGIEPVAVGAAMLQSERWRPRLDELDPKWRPRIVSVFSTPILEPAAGGGWQRPCPLEAGPPKADPA